MTDQRLQTILCENCETLNSDYAKWCRKCGVAFSENPIRILPPGTVLEEGHFTITAFLGRGGSALTYRARQKNFTTEVAVKEYYPEGIAVRDSEGYNVRPAGLDLEIDYERGLQQFMHAGNTLHSLGTIPNIVTVHDAFKEYGTAYITEDYIGGRSLSEILLQKKRFSFDEALNFMRPLIQALIRVHESGVIHRDINPSNIMVSDGIAYLIDFGIARNIRNHTTVSSVHQNRAEMGISYTRGYSAPEQITGMAQEATWTDVYGIAATMYRMITGNEPDDAKSRLINDLLPPVDAVADVTIMQSDVIMQGMALNTVARYQNMGAFLAALEYCVEDKKNPEPVPYKAADENSERNEKKSQTFFLQTAIILIMCALIGIVGYYLFGVKGFRPFGGSSSAENEESPSDASASTESEEQAASNSTEKVDELSSSAEEVIPEAGYDQGTEIRHLRADVGVSGDMRIDGEPTINPYVFGNTSYRREDIEYITFLNSLSERPGNAWDVSGDRNGEVYAWVEGGHLFIGADGIIGLPSDCTGLFSYYTNVKHIDFGSGIDTSDVTNMRFMFKQDMQLTGLDLSSFDTSCVESMDRMFTQCRSIMDLDLSNFDTSRSTNMQALFAHCYALTNLDVSSFNTARVTDMAYIFYNCKSIREIDIRNFDTSLVTSGKCMFLNCENLRTLYFDVYKFRTGSMTNMHAMFSNCKSLTSLDVSHFDTSRVTDMEYMFNNDGSLTELAYRNFDMSRVENRGDMLTGTIWE